MLYEIIVTEKCNLNCKYCYESLKGENVLTESKIQDIISYIKRDVRSKNHKETSISINGGEALSNYPVVTKLIDELKINGISKISISTNLTLATKEMLRYFYENGVTLHVSIDGKKDSHDLNRQYHSGKGSYDDVIRNVNYLTTAYKDWFVSYSLVFTPQTVGNLCKNVKYLYDIGIKYLSACYCADSHWEDDSYNKFRGQVEHLAKLYIEKIKNNDNFYFSLFCDAVTNTLKGCGFCGMVQSHRAILPNGDILPCAMFTGNMGTQDFCIGTIYDGINNTKAKELVTKMAMNTSECTGCALINRCHKYCFATNHRVSGDLLKIPDSICMINQICLLQADKIIDYFYHDNLDVFLKKFNIRKAAA